MKETAKEILQEGLLVLSKRNIAPRNIMDPKYARILIELMELVLDHNKTHNLTTIIEPLEFVRLHLLDSLACIGMK